MGFRFRAKPTEVELLLVGRIFVLVLVAISVVWIPIIQVSNRFILTLITPEIIFTGKSGLPTVQLHPIHHILPRSSYLCRLSFGNILAQVDSHQGWDV